MRTTRIMTACAGLLLMGFATSLACAQAEIDPDHYDTPGLERVQPLAAKDATHYDGHLRLPYSVQCKGNNLAPGRYSISLNSDGRTALLVMHRKGETVRIQGVAQRHTGNPGRDVLLVERNDGTPPMLLAIHSAQLDFVFDSAPGYKQMSSARTKSIEELPLALKDARK